MLEFDEKGAAEYLGSAPKTMANRRSRGDGPPYYKLGNRVRYRKEDLDAWLATRRRTSTSDTGIISTNAAP